MVRSFFRQSDDLARLVRWIRRNRAIRKRSPLFAEYLEKEATKPKLQLGSGANLLPGWLNTDMSGTEFFLDITEPLPFQDAAFNFILCEHTIEHIEFNDAVFMLGECRRILKPGGKMRISTPDLAVYASMVFAEDQNTIEVVQRTFADWIVPGFYAAKNYTPPSGANRAAFVLNDIFRNYEHKFIYDLHTLRLIIQNAGFQNVVRVRSGVSTTPELDGVETHTSSSDIFLSLTVEATRI